MKYFRKPFWPGPYPPEIMLNQEVVRLEEEFIKANKLMPYKIEARELEEYRVMFRMEKVPQELVYWIWENGGKRGPHFHYRGEIYVLNEKQWNEFSKQLVHVFSNMLASANTISFDQMAEMARIVDDP